MRPDLTPEPPSTGCTPGFNSIKEKLKAGVFFMARKRSTITVLDALSEYEFVPPIYPQWYSHTKRWMSSQRFCEVVPEVVSVDWDQARGEDVAAHVDALADADQAMAVSVCGLVVWVLARVPARPYTLTIQGYSTDDRSNRLPSPG